MGSYRKRVLAGITAGSGVVILAGAAEASGGGAISVFPDHTCFWQVINFLVLIWALNLIVYRPIRSILARRREHMSGLDKNIEQFKRDAEEKESAFTDGIKDAKSEGMKAKNAIMEEGAAEERQLLESISQKAQQALAENKAKIAEDVKKAAVELQQEIDAFAAEIGRKILGRELS